MSLTLRQARKWSTNLPTHELTQKPLPRPLLAQENPPFVGSGGSQILPMNILPLNVSARFILRNAKGRCHFCGQCLLCVHGWLEENKQRAGQVGGVVAPKEDKQRAGQAGWKESQQQAEQAGSEEDNQQVVQPGSNEDKQPAGEAGPLLCFQLFTLNFVKPINTTLPTHMGDGR